MINAVELLNNKNDKPYRKHVTFNACEIVPIS